MRQSLAELDALKKSRHNAKRAEEAASHARARNAIERVLSAAAAAEDRADAAGAKAAAEHAALEHELMGARAQQNALAELEVLRAAAAQLVAVRARAPFPPSHSSCVPAFATRVAGPRRCELRTPSCAAH